MDVAVVISNKDPAGLNIKEHLLKEGFDNSGLKFENMPVLEAKLKNRTVKVYTTESESVHCEHIDELISADIFLFATKHQSAAGIHSFTVHSIGNFGKAAFGGKERTLGIAPSFYLKTGFQVLSELNVLKHDVIQEATHHGPYVEKQAMFLEIGSSIEEWKNPAAGKIAAKSIIKLFSAPEQPCRPAFGIGGLHHSPNFKKLIMESDIALSHICPKHNLPNLDEEMLLQAIEKSIPKAKLIVLDWKGLGKEKARIKKLAEGTGFEIMKV